MVPLQRTERERGPSRSQSWISRVCGFGSSFLGTDRLMTSCGPRKLPHPRAPPELRMIPLPLVMRMRSRASERHARRRLESSVEDEERGEGRRGE